MEKRFLGFLWTVRKRSFSCVVFPDSLQNLRVTNSGRSPKPKCPHRCRIGRIQLTAFIPQPCFTEICPCYHVQSIALNHRPFRSLLQADEGTRCKGDQNSCVQYFHWISQLAPTYKSEIVKLILRGWPTGCFNKYWFCILNICPKGRRRSNDHTWPPKPTICTL